MFRAGLASIAAVTILAWGPAPGTAQTRCEVPSPERLEGRPSPYDSTVVELVGGTAKVCYGRPSARGRTMLGGRLPFGELWRLGANEPTVLHLDVRAELAGIELAPGSYSLYAVPERERWTIFLSSAVDRWGIPIDDAVRALEVGSTTVGTEPTDAFVESLAIRLRRVGDLQAELVIEWERTRVRIPLCLDP